MPKVLPIGPAEISFFLLPKQYKRQYHMFQVSIHLSQTSHLSQQKLLALRERKDLSIPLVFKQLHITEQNLKAYNL